MKLHVNNVSYNPFVNHLSCAISQGITYIVGKNGSGKSTFLKLCATAIEPSAGTIIYSTKNPHSNEWIEMAVEDVRKTIGFLPQQFTGYPELSIEKYIRYMATHKGIPYVYVKDITKQWLEKTGLYPIRRKRLGSLSGGQLKKIGLIQALINQPRICILDEPFEHLDLTERLFFEHEIQKLAQSSIILMSTHLMNQDGDGHILHLENGQIVQHDRCTEIVYKAILKRLEE